jgi:hypothetical protein
VRHAGKHVLPCAQLDGFVHTTSHAHELLHEMFWHDSLPVQTTSHGPGPHTMPWFVHVDCALHAIMHDAALLQSMPFLHAFCWLHSIVQWNPLGHASPVLQFAVWQLMSHVFCPRLHVVQPAGQPLFPSRPVGASICVPSDTQKPSWQVRPVLQSDGLVHV